MSKARAKVSPDARVYADLECVTFCDPEVYQIDVSVKSIQYKSLPLNTILNCVNQREGVHILKRKYQMKIIKR